MAEVRFVERVYPISESMNQVLRILQYRRDDGTWVDVPVVSLQEQYEKEVKEE